MAMATEALRPPTPRNHPAQPRHRPHPVGAGAGHAQAQHQVQGWAGIPGGPDRADGAGRHMAGAGRQGEEGVAREQPATGARMRPRFRAFGPGGWPGAPGPHQQQQPPPQQQQREGAWGTDAEGGWRNMLILPSMAWVVVRRGGEGLVASSGIGEKQRG